MSGAADQSSTHGDCAHRLREAMRELQAVPGIEFRAGELEGGIESFASPEEVETAIMGQFGRRLPRALRECSVAHEQLACSWWIDGPQRPVTGEFTLRPPCICMPVYPPSTDWEMPAFEKELSEQLLLIDDFPEGGTDAYAALRLRPADEPEIWYHEAERGALRLDLDYCTYLRMLAVTKGAVGWHFLFADVSLSESEFSSYAEPLKDMVTVFPALFPDYNYTPLRKRLEARL